jgi:hypothetical protein
LLSYYHNNIDGDTQDKVPSEVATRQENIHWDSHLSIVTGEELLGSHQLV